MNKKISMYREILGYSSGDRKQPIYAPMPGALVTQAFIHCSQCMEAISGTMGPRRDAWCISCADKKVGTDAKEKVANRKKRAAERLAARRMAEAEEAAKRKAKEEAENRGE